MQKKIGVYRQGTKFFPINRFLRLFSITFKDPITIKHQKKKIKAIATKKNIY